METYLVTIYVICDEVFRALGMNDHTQSQMTNAEIATFSIITAKHFSGNYCKSRFFCKRLRLFPKMLSLSRLNRRIHNIPWHYWNAIFRFLAIWFQQASTDKEFAVDSFPVSCCEKGRFDKRKLFLGKQYIGYMATKKRYFCGIRIHMIVTSEGKPIEYLFKPGSESDISVLWQMEIDIPPFSKLYADGAYNCFELEDMLNEENIMLLAKRSSNAKNRVRTTSEEQNISSKRQIIETAFSCITDLFPRNLRACTEEGFIIKILCAILAYSMSFVCPNPLS